MSSRSSIWARQELVVAAPPMMVVLGSLLSVLWEGLDLPGNGLLFPPPTLLAAAIVITGALAGLAGNQLLRHPSWPIFALSSLSFLTVAALSGRGAVGGAEALTSAFPVGALLRMLWMGVAIALAIGLGKTDTRRVILFFGLFLAGEVSRFPSGGPGDGQGVWVPVALAVVMLAESVVVAWVVVVLSRGAEGVAFGVLIVLLLLHPLLTTWQAFLLEPGGLGAYLQTAVAAGASLGVLMALAFALHRLTVGLGRRVR